MTTKIELLPLPEGNVAHLIAGQDAKIEALRAEVDRLAEALRELEEREQRDEALLRQALEALELRCGTNADERKELIPALRERLGPWGGCGECVGHEVIQPAGDGARVTDTDTGEAT